MIAVTEFFFAHALPKLNPFTTITEKRQIGVEAFSCDSPTFPLHSWVARSVILASTGMPPLNPKGSSP